MYQNKLNEILDLSSRETTKARKKAIKLLWDKASQYSSALIDYSATFKQIKEDSYKKSISATNHEAGEITGYRHKKIEVEIKAVEALIDYLSDLEAQVSPKQAQQGHPQSSSSTSEEQASQTEPE